MSCRKQDFLSKINTEKRFSLSPRIFRKSHNLEMGMDVAFPVYKLQRAVGVWTQAMRG